MKILRKLRGALGTALLWSAAWLPFGVMLSIATWIDIHSRNNKFPVKMFSQILVFETLLFCAWGFLSGALFALTISIVERKRKNIDALPIKRIMTWGALSALAIPLVMTYSGLPALGALIYGGISGVFGAALAGGTLRLARRADPVLASVSPLQLAGHDANLVD